MLNFIKLIAKNLCLNIFNGLKLKYDTEIIINKSKTVKLMKISGKAVKKKSYHTVVFVVISHGCLR